MHRSTIRLTGAALLLVPMVSTCTLPQGMTAVAHEHSSAPSEDRLVKFLIDGSAGGTGTR